MTIKNKKTAVMLTAIAVTATLAVTMALVAVAPQASASHNSEPTMALINTNNMSSADIQMSTQSPNVNLMFDFTNSSITIGEPEYYEHSYSHEDLGARFVLYEDFPIRTRLSTEKLDLSMVNVPTGVWSTFILNNTISDSNTISPVVLRVMGAVKPFMPTQFNNTLYVVGDKDENGVVPVASTHIIRNQILEENFVIRNSIPIKFKSKILTASNHKRASIFGIVHDPSLQDRYDLEGMVTSTINVNIEPIGIMSNGNLEDIPPWLDIEMLNFPLSLKEKQPNYFVMVTHTSNAPKGIYEIALRETISSKVFIETITLTVVG